ncbi:uncharacterized protein LOC144634462 isoform X1 [Oculina patagonica]
MSSKRSEPVGKWTPSEARYEFRTNPDLEGSSTSGYCMGYLQANLAILPSSLADEFEQFCELNKAPCPLLYRSKCGELSAGILAQESDVRTDLPKYCVSENGIITKKTGDLMAYPLDDYVPFYIGCSFSFEEALTNAGIQLQNVVENRNVSMFLTNIQCVPVGPFASPMVVSMRPIPRDLVEKAVIITAAYDAVHGAPIHIGDPSVIGIDENHVDFGDPSDVGDLIPMFWACGVTSSVAVRTAKPPLSFSHSPGSMFICDTTVEEYFKTHKPEHGEEQPRLITLTERPFLASVCSASAFHKVEQVAKLLLLESPSNGTKNVQVDDFMKIAVRLSQAPSVVIGFLHEKDSLSSQNATSDILCGALVLIKALQALKKKITIVTQYHSQLIHDCVTTAQERGVSKEGVCVVELSEGVDIKQALYPDKINHRLDAMIALHAARNPSTVEEDVKKGLVDTLFKEANSWVNNIVSITITADRKQTSLTGDVSSMDHHVMITSSLKTATNCLAGALYVLNNCLIHSRYARRGIGKRQLFQAEQFLLNDTDQEGVSSQILHCITDN